jgi:syntaxin 6
VRRLTEVEYSEVETAFETLSTLSEAYSRDADDWTLSELKAGLLAINPDVQELEESVQAVEEPGVARRLGIESSEVKRRREFVNRVKQEIAVRAIQDDPNVRLPGILTDNYFHSRKQKIRRRLPATASRSPSPVRARTFA